MIKGCTSAKESTKLCYHNDHRRIAEEFNTYFTSVTRLTADKVRKLAEENGVLTTHPEVSTIYNHIASEEMFHLRDASPNEVRRIILEAPSTKPQDQTK